MQELGEHINIQPTIYEREKHEKMEKLRANFWKEFIEALEKVESETKKEVKEEHTALYNKVLAEVCAEYMQKWRDILESNK